MSDDLSAIVGLWKKWRPHGPAKRLIPLCLLGWLIINSSSICLFLLDNDSPFLAVLNLLPASLKALSGKLWITNWLNLWQLIPLFIPLALIPALIWLRKPTIFTAAILAVAGMWTGPGNRILAGGLAVFSLPFAVIFLAFMLLVQKIWNNWDSPAPAPEKIKLDKEKRAQKWPLRKRVLLVAIPWLIYCLSSSLCALGGAWRAECEVAKTGYALEVGPASFGKDGVSFTVKEIKRSADFSLAHLAQETWKGSQFAPALLGRLPHSWYSFLDSFGKRFSFVFLFLILYAIWLWRPGWLFYWLTTGFFLIGVYMAKTRLVWQFSLPPEGIQQLKGHFAYLIYLWARYSPF